MEFELTAPNASGGENAFELEIYKTPVIILKYQIFMISPQETQNTSLVSLETTSVSLVSLMTQISCQHYTALKVADEAIRPTPCRLCDPPELQNRYFKALLVPFHTNRQ